VRGHLLEKHLIMRTNHPAEGLSGIITVPIGAICRGGGVVSTPAGLGERGAAVGRLVCPATNGGVVVVNGRIICIVIISSLVNFGDTPIIGKSSDDEDNIMC